MAESQGTSPQKYSLNDSDEKDYKFKLKEPLNLNEVINGGAIFEIDESALRKDLVENEPLRVDLADPALFSVLHTGRYCMGDELSDSDEDFEPFTKLASNMEDMTYDGGVHKKIVSQGQGADISETATVIYKYSAYLEFADDPFDSTLFRSKPHKTHLSKPDVILGLQIALKSMRRKETAHFLIRDDYAFGPLGCPPRIPPNSTLFYEITVLDAVDYSASHDYENLPEEQTLDVPFEQKAKVAEEHLALGNHQFKEKQYKKARSTYRSGTWIIESGKVTNEEDSKTQLDILFRLHTNSAQANLNLFDAKSACRRCQDALRYSAGQPKAMLAKVYFRYATAKMKLQDLEIALRYAKKSRSLCDTKETRELVQKMAERIQEVEKSQKEMYENMFNMTLDEKPIIESQLSEEFKREVQQYIEYVETSDKDINVHHTFNENQLRYIKREVKNAGLLYTIYTRYNKKFFKLYK